MLTALRFWLNFDLAFDYFGSVTPSASVDTPDMTQDVVPADRFQAIPSIMHVLVLLDHEFLFQLYSYSKTFLFVICDDVPLDCSLFGYL